MVRSAKQANQQVNEKLSVLQEGFIALGDMIARNPSLVGGSTAFMLVLFYVSANALWYQPYTHKVAFFATREAVEFPDMADTSETTIKIERPDPDKVAQITIDNKRVEQVQSILKDLNFYSSAVDGLKGPATRGAIQAYQRKVGLVATGEIDQSLLQQLEAGDTTANIMPTPRPRVMEMTRQVPTPRTKAQPTFALSRAALSAEIDVQARIRKIQVGLKSFGNEAIDADGIIGAKTRSAIRDFQALFDLPETGEPDQAVYAKMREIGLAN